MLNKVTILENIVIHRYLEDHRLKQVVLNSCPNLTMMVESIPRVLNKVTTPESIVMEMTPIKATIRAYLKVIFINLKTNFF